MREGLVRQDDGNGGFGEVVVVVGKWLWMWGGGCGGGCRWEGGVGVKRGCDEQQCDMGGYGTWVQVMVCEDRGFGKGGCEEEG